MRDLHTTEVHNDGRFPAELQAWLSPSFPVGGFAYSQGLEWAVEAGAIYDAASLEDWLRALLQVGSIKSDLIFLSLVGRAATDGELWELAELSAAMQPSRERAEEALQQGWSFLQAYNAAWASDPLLVITPPDGVRVTLPVALGLAARAYAFPGDAVLHAYANAFLMNAISAAIRLSAIGQFDGQRCLARLLPDVRAACAMAMTATVQDIGSCTFAADLATLKHETQTTRLFRS